ncbi:Eco57I restriction-modification methylase domain-containing protein [uncultured Dialister sp.]|uniref:Eco57I restriction-modification methylase domain-containing protein n=1 Tax=uncultured Dialister sp. TaxID=278064 RepID=UPI0025EF1A72|nr:Eco57I restriction-modification methylase domain-containing protein [uncultured Dialister sp.]
MGKKKFFDFVIGNPPYQESMDSTSDKSVYNILMDASYEVGQKSEFITPARFLFNAGKTPKPWNKKMLNDIHLKVLEYEKNSAKVFANTDIKGGVAITYYDRESDYGAIVHFIPDDTLRGILNKVRSRKEQTLNENVNGTEYYKLSPVLYEEHPEILTTKIMWKNKEVPLVSKGHEYDLTSNILDKDPALFSFKKSDDDSYCRVYGRKGGQRVFMYIKRKYLKDSPGLHSYKVILPESNNSGEFGETLVNPFVGDPDVATTQTFITIGFFDTINEAEAVKKYISGKFARALLGTLKITQHNKQDVWKNVPVQDFSKCSNIDWSKSIHEIDLQLYKKYGLSSDEIDFIESHVKEMK